jgi:integration host factor subunit beta
MLVRGQSVSPSGGRGSQPIALRHDMETITKKELIDRISEKCDVKRVTVKRVLQTFLDEIIDELGRGNRLEFRDFGVFESKMRAARTAQNPKTLERVSVPSKRTVKFKVGRLMKARLIEAGLAAPVPAKERLAK